MRITHFEMFSFLFNTYNMNSYILVFLILLPLSLTTGLPQCSSLCSVNNCASCINSTCSSCMIGYTLTTTSNTSIISCTKNNCTISNCSLCSASGACLKCADPYSIYNLTVGSCVQQCSLSNCDLCKAGSN